MQKNKIKFTSIILAIFYLLFNCLGCAKLVDVSAPATSLNSANVFNNDATATAVMTGVYTNMAGSTTLTSQNLLSISLYVGMSSDEFSLNIEDNVSYKEFYKNALNKNDITPDYWGVIYPKIYVVNAAIEGLSAATSLTPAIKQQALGEAKFMRAFYYFYLVNLYGDVPLVLTSDYKTNSSIARTSKSQVWVQIIKDLQDAQNLLSENFLDGSLLIATSQRLRPTKWAATALLSRTYLYTGDWLNAKLQADLLINNTSLFGLTELSNVFLAYNNNEAIWQLQQVVFGYNTPDAQTLIIPSTGPGNNWPVSLSDNLLNSFELGDLRRTNWVDSVIIGANTFYYSHKYKNNFLKSTITEYDMVMRLGEQYLIRAEAEANGAPGGIPAAISDLNQIRARAGLNPYSDTTDQSFVLNAIYHERQVELFSEWGHRWFDLKRTGNINSVMGSPGNICQSKGGIWDPNWQWYPILLSQIKSDPKLIQNPGYN